MHVTRSLLPAVALVLALSPVARGADAYLPDDPGIAGSTSGWTQTQWNFAGPFGVNATGAWANLRRVGRPGGRGVIVAVLDTGVAYRSAGAQRRSPGLPRESFVRGYDVVDHDPYPVDRNGHGTHVASTIAEATDDGAGFTGLAYGARIMPVRVLRDDGDGEARDVARGVRWATTHGAQIINLSAEFDERRPASEGAGLLAAVREATRRGVVVVAAAGNDANPRPSLPARSRSVISVGATTEHGCLSAFSNLGADLVSPGGGSDAALPGDPRCDPADDTLRDITQTTLRDGRFGPSFGYAGTSMAAAHVSAAAALVIASRTLGRHPSPAAVRRRLERTSRDLGRPGRDAQYGAGLLDAAAATAP